jgi:hypothetical protein
MATRSSLNDAEMEVIPGTQGASYPFFSPDDDELGFFAGGGLKKVSLRGGNWSEVIRRPR